MAEEKAAYNPADNMLNLIPRLASKIQIEGECWVWNAARSDNGYGVAYDGKRTRRAHRVVYESLAGPVPEGHDLDHLCRNRACVNPAHLEPVTRSENLRRGYAAAPRPLASHCHRGHEYTEANTYRWRGQRACRACHALRGRESRK